MVVMDRTEQKIAVMQAYTKGQTIEMSMDGGSTWSVCNYPTWDWSKHLYRIKSNKGFVPYTNGMDFLKDQEEHGPYLMHKHGTDRWSIGVAYYFDALHCIVSHGGEGYEKNMQTVFNDFVWQDGHPFGKEVPNDN